MSPNPSQSVAQGQPQASSLRWHASRWLGLAAGLLLLPLGLGLYQRVFQLTVLPPPPAVDLAGVDPAVAAAVEQARTRVQEAPRSAAAWGKLGMVLLVHDFQPQAVVSFDQAERLDRREPRWPYYLGLEALLRGDQQAAREKLEQTVALSGDELDGPRLVLADTLLGLDDLDGAERNYSLLLKKNSRHDRARLGLARAAVKRGDLRASLDLLRLVQSSPFTRRAANELLAEVFHRLDEPTKAEAARRTAAELPPDRNWPDPLREELAAVRTGKVNRLRQAEALDREGEKAEAIALLMRTVRDYPDADDAWLALGKVLLEQKKLTSAEAAVRRAVALAPTVPEPVNELGRVLAAQGNRAEAIKCFRKALELRPNFAQAWHNLGSSLAATNDRSGAIDAYTQAVRYAPDVFESQFALALLLADKGQLAEALVHTQQAARLNPSHQPAQRLLEQLKKQQASSQPEP